MAVNQLRGEREAGNRRDARLLARLVAGSPGARPTRFDSELLSVRSSPGFTTTGRLVDRYATVIEAIAPRGGHSIKLAKRREKKQKQREWLTREQWLALYDELPPHLQPPAAFSIETGLRQDNVLGRPGAQAALDRG